MHKPKQETTDRYVKTLYKKALRAPFLSIPISYPRKVDIYYPNVFLPSKDTAILPGTRITM